MLKGYQNVRPISPREREVLPLLARGSALRFLLTRATTGCTPRKDALVKPHDPLEYLRRLKFHRRCAPPPTTAGRPARATPKPPSSSIPTAPAREIRARAAGRDADLGEHRKELSGGEAQTTNNRMELMAAISALEALKRPSQVDLHTDSKYVQNGITKWIHGWKRNGWKTADKQAGQERRPLEAPRRRRQRHEVEWHWVKGHAGHEDNERADELAREGMQPFLRR